MTPAKYVMDAASLGANVDKPMIYKMRKKEIEVKYLSGSTQKWANGATVPLQLDCLAIDYVRESIRASSHVTNESEVHLLNVGYRLEEVF